MTTHYVGFAIDPDGSNYIIGQELLSASVIRRINEPAVYQFQIHNPNGIRNSLITNDDVCHIHVGHHPLFQWNSLSALAFNGVNDGILIPAATAPFNAVFTGISVACWIYPTTLGDTVNFRNIVSQDWDNDGGWLLMTEKTTAKAFFGMAFSGQHQARSNDDLVVNRWYHLCGTYDGTTVKLYVNGVLQDITATTVQVNWQNSSNIVYMPPGNAASHEGIIDDLIFYNDAVTQGEIVNIMKGDPHSANMIARYRFDEGIGSAVIDHIGDANSTVRRATVAIDSLWVNPRVIKALVQDIEIQRPRRGQNLMTVRGEDYLTVLANRLARSDNPGTVNISTVLTNIVEEAASGEFGTSNVDAVAGGSVVSVADYGETAKRPILAIMRDLANYPDAEPFDFYLGADNEIHWHSRNNAAYTSGVTLSGSNIKSFKVSKSTKNKKNFIYVKGALTPSEGTENAQVITTDNDTVSAKHLADDFVAQRGALLKISLYMRKIGTPAVDFTGRIVVAKNGTPSGDYRAFRVREEDVSTSAGWVTINTGMTLQKGSRYFIKIDKGGTNVSNTYEMYGDGPAVIDTRYKALSSSDANALRWVEWDFDMAMKIHYGIETEVTSDGSDGTPQRDGTIVLRRYLDETTAQYLADRVLNNYLQTQFEAEVTADITTNNPLTPGDIITLDETDTGLDSKIYRMNQIRWNFGAGRKATENVISMTSALPFESIETIVSRLLDEQIEGTDFGLQSATEQGAYPAQIGLAKVGRTLVGYIPE